MKKVNILLSVYKPDINYLKKQLVSLDKQTYGNIELIIFDDCVDDRCDVTVFKECLAHIPYRILPYERVNLGYTKAFEKLVVASDGAYLAFCDQDDIWLPEKIEKCVIQMEKDDSLAVATDRAIIDECDQVIHDSVRAVSDKPYDAWESCADICKYNFFIAYAVGMSMMVDGLFARKCVPFSAHTGHDKWLLACASSQGKVSFIHESLVRYRRHGKNVSGTLKGIHNKKDYMQNRVMDHIGVIEDFEKMFPEDKNLEEVKKFAYARKTHDIITLFKYRYLAPDLAKFEILLCFVPDFCFETLLKFVRKLNDKVIS